MINTQLLVGYKEIYGENHYEISELIADLPVKKVGQIISKMNLEIHIGNDNAEQMKYFAYFTSHLSASERGRIIERTIGVKKEYVSPENIFYFTRHSLLYLFYLILKKSKNQTSGIENNLTEKQRDDLFKAILIINDQVNQRSYNRGTDFSQYEEYRKFMWQTSNLQNQFESSDPIIKIIKAKCLFDLLQNDELYTSEITKYLNEHEAENTWTLLLKHRLHPYINSSQMVQQPGESTHTLQINSPQKKFINSLIINESEILEKDFSLRIYKETPLLKITEDQCVVLDWGLYNEQLFESIIFDFYHSTRLKEIGQFKDFLHYKNELIDKHFYENYLLDKIIKILFPKKHQVKLNEDDLRKMAKKLTPDFYVRDGNDIYLIEFKNSYYPASIDKNSDYEQIKKCIDIKFNTNDAGVGQQVKRIKFLVSDSYENNNEGRYPKNRNLNIYPILIFSDINFDIPGVGRYLSDSFNSQIDSSTSSVFKNITPLIFIHVDYFFEHIHLFMKKPSVFKDHLTRFSRFQSAQKKKLPNSPSQFRTNQKLDLPFSYRIRNLYNYEKRSRELLEASFEAFDLRQNT